jgi:hypothetical protein
LIEEKKIKLARVKQSLGLPWKRYDVLLTRSRGETPSEGESFRAEMSFNAWSAMPCTQMAKRAAGGHMRISATIQVVVERGINPSRKPQDVS